MADAFLQRVMAQRRVEQRQSRITPEMIGGENCDMGAAFHLEDAARRAWLDSLTRPQNCEVCGDVVRQGPDDGDERVPLTVCSGCGGRKKQERLRAEERRLEEFRAGLQREREQQRAAELERATKQQRRRDWLLGLVGIQPEGGAMEAEVVESASRVCSKGCGRKLGPNNRSGICTPCQQEKSGDDELAGEKPRRGGAKKKSDALKRFRIVAEAVGEDPDALLEEFAEAYLEKLKLAAAKRS